MSRIVQAVRSSNALRGATVTDGRTVQSPPQRVELAPPVQVEPEAVDAAAVPVPDDPIPLIYDGEEASCSICTEAFRHGERVCRLRCRHMFHTQCWDDYVVANRWP